MSITCPLTKSPAETAIHIVPINENSGRSSFNSTIIYNYTSRTGRDRVTQVEKEYKSYVGFGFNRLQWIRSYSAPNGRESELNKRTKGESKMVSNGIFWAPEFQSRNRIIKKFGIGN